MSMSVARVLLGRSASVVAARAPRQRPYRRRRRTAPVAGTRTSSSNAEREQQQQQASDQAHQDSAGFPHVSVMLDENAFDDDDVLAKVFALLVGLLGMRRVGQCQRRCAAEERQGYLAPCKQS